LRRLGVVVGPAGRADRGGEGGDLLPADGERSRGWVLAAGVVGVEGHARQPNGDAATSPARTAYPGHDEGRHPGRVTASRALTSCRQRVSRWAVCLPQRGQNFAISSRSGLFRRFFLVM